MPSAFTSPAVDTDCPKKSTEFSPENLLNNFGCDCACAIAGKAVSNTYKDVMIILDLLACIVIGLSKKALI
jgi:hypothetical protein